MTAALYRPRIPLVCALRQRSLERLIRFADLFTVNESPSIGTCAAPRAATPERSGLRQRFWAVVRALGQPAPVPALPAAHASPADATLRTRARFGRWLNRPRRILLTLGLIWVIAIFDLGYTLAESGTLDFRELNPVAERLLGGPAQHVVAYKFGLLAFASCILLLLRQHATAEWACWFLFVVMIYVAIRWLSYFDCVLHNDTNPLLHVSG